MFKNINEKHDMTISYQGIQKFEGQLIVKIDQKPDKFLNKIIKNEFKKYTSADLTIVIKELKLKGKSLKFRDFISKL